MWVAEARLASPTGLCHREKRGTAYIYIYIYIFVLKKDLLQYCLLLSLLGKCYCLINFFLAFVTNRLNNVSINFTVSNLIFVQQDATVFSLLYFCTQLYMFRMLTPIIRSSYNCNYSFWHWSTGSATIRESGWPTPEAVITVVRAPDDGCQHPKHVELRTEI